MITSNIFTTERNCVWDDLKHIHGEDFLNFSLIRLGLKKCLEKILLTLVVFVCMIRVCEYGCTHDSVH